MRTILRDQTKKFFDVIQKWIEPKKRARRRVKLSWYTLYAYQSPPSTFSRTMLWVTWSMGVIIALLKWTIDSVFFVQVAKSSHSNSTCPSTRSINYELFIIFPPVASRRKVCMVKYLVQYIILAELLNYSPWSSSSYLLVDYLPGNVFYIGVRANSTSN